LVSGRNESGEGQERIQLLLVIKLLECHGIL
jgi:hypothetical protein